MKETAHPGVGLLQAFDRGALAPGEWAAVEEHLACCHASGQTLQNLPDLTLNEVVKELLDGAGTHAGYVSFRINHQPVLTEIDDQAFLCPILPDHAHAAPAAHARGPGSAHPYGR